MGGASRGAAERVNSFLGENLGTPGFEPQTFQNNCSYKIHTFLHQIIIRHLVSFHRVKMN